MKNASNHVPLIVMATASVFGNRRACFDPEGTAAPAPATTSAEPLANLRTEFSRLQTEAQGVLDTAVAAKRDLTADEITANDTRFARLTTIKNTIDQREKFAAMVLSNPTSTVAVQRTTEPSGRQEYAASQNGVEFQTLEIETADQARARYAKDKAVIERWIRFGDARGVRFASNDGTEFTTNSALTTGSGSNALLPTTVAAPVVLKRLTNPLRQAMLARGTPVISTSDTGILSVPVFDDTANTADAIPQNQTGDNEKEPGLAALTLGNQLYDSGTMWASNTLLNSLTFDLLGYLQPQLEKRLDLKQAALWMTSLATTATVGVTTGSTSTVTYPELIAWQHSIAPVNRPYGVFILSDGLFQTIRNLTDSQGRPLYQDSLQDDAPDKLLGWPVFITDQLAAPGATVVAGIAVATNLIFIRDITNKRIVRYVNIPTYRDQFGLAEFANGDFQFLPGGARALKFHA